ncbi:MAG: AMP-binding protein [Candidatus Lokiarchaeota archaeon]|nr:AMP-binding protein [Candidatus Lokiarchaeota archaeon]MBD3339051.1 AMP-binding protein [Candidatus Lokiarchaeota archaeon]
MQNMEESPYKNKIWTKSYDTYVKPELDDLFQNISLAETLMNTVKKYPTNLCYEFMGTTSTYQEFEKKVVSFANFLDSNGVKKGDKVAINLPNSPQYMVALYGSFYVGATVSGMNFLLQPNEIIYQLSDSEAKVLVTMDSFYEESVRKALASGKTNVELVITTNITDLMEISSIKVWLGKLLKKVPSGKVIPVDGMKFFEFKEILEDYPNENPPRVKYDPQNDIAFLQYTGGTTGPPKGAILTHSNEMANMAQVVHWLDKLVSKGNDIFISGFPFFHLAGLFFGLASVYLGAQQLLIANPRDTAHISKLVDKWNPTFMLNVPTLYMMLINDQNFREVDLSSIRVYGSGAAPFPSDKIRDFEEIVGKNMVLEVYGMTEASPLVTANPVENTRKIGTIGLPIPNTEVKIVDTSDKSKEMPLGEAGEIVIRGPQVFKGYWKKPKESENALKDGWFYSGDVGVMDDEGYITVVDRTKDMIIVGGYKVFSVEVDEKMSKHPAIELCSTVGIPNPKRPETEIVKLYVKLKEGYQKSDEMKEEIFEYARNNLAKYKVPKEIELVEEIPLTSVGKIDKKALRSN